MPKSQTKLIGCHKCRFVFEVPKTLEEFDGCYTPTYCEKQYLLEWAKEVLDAANNYAMGNTPQG